MFNEAYFYLYVVSAMLISALQDTMKTINPSNPYMISFMGTIGLLCKIANMALLVLCLFFSWRWWYAPIMWVVGFILSTLIPPIRAGRILGHIGIIGAPICTLLAYLDLFGVI